MDRDGPFIQVFKRKRGTLKTGIYSNQVLGGNGGGHHKQDANAVLHIIKYISRHPLAVLHVILLPMQQSSAPSNFNLDLPTKPPHD